MSRLSTCSSRINTTTASLSITLYTIHNKILHVYILYMYMRICIVHVHVMCYWVDLNWQNKHYVHVNACIINSRAR